MTDSIHSSITPVNIEEELKSSYLDYAMSVIVGRALPDVRDGLKPVHRRVLFSMDQSGITAGKKYVKSARVVGDVIGKYHPHGDSAVYDTIVRRAQPFSLRYMLVDGQGNFGSIDGDAPAAMRYTEVRMQKITQALLTDLDKETVNFSPNYDGELMIPDVLPTRIPALLANGSSGIAVGMATNIPPHNLNEVLDGCLAYIDNENITIDELMQYIPGPDFPTAALINGRKGIEEAYRTGRGKVYVRARASVETTDKGKEQIIVTELPYQVNKANIVGHSMGGVSGLRYLGTYGQDASLPKIEKFVSIGAPFNDFIDTSQQQTIETELENGPTEKSSRYLDYQEMINVVPEKLPILLIGGQLSPTDLSDGTVPLSSALAVNALLRQRGTQVTSQIIKGEHAQHSQLHENPEVDQLLIEFLWPSKK